MEENSIKVSVIVPVYNVEKFLSRCLESLLNQTLKDIEIICINDGSTDKSLEILKTYIQQTSSPPPSKLKIISTENKGQSAARNLGLKMARGEYIGFVDADDWVDLDFFEKLYDASKGIYDVVCTDAVSYPDGKGYITYKKRKLVYSTQEKIDAIGVPKNFSIWNKIYKTSKLKDSNILFTEGRYFEDVEFLLNVINYMSCVLTIPGKGAKYYYNKTNSLSTTRQKTEKHLCDHIWAMNYYSKFAEKYNIEIKNSYSSYVKFLGIEFLKIHHELDMVNYKLFNFIPVLTIYKK